MNKAKILSDLKKHRDKIAKERDAIREVYDALEDNLECFDRGMWELESAIEIFSEIL